jgi:hypothetical protein
MACLFESEDEKRCAVRQTQPTELCAGACVRETVSLSATHFLSCCFHPQKLFAKVAELWCDNLAELLETQGVGTFDSLGQALVCP